MENDLTVDGNAVSVNELEDLQQDPKLKLKKVTETTYTTKQRLQG